MGRRRSVLFLFVLLALAGRIMAQPTATLTDSSESFSIRSGSTFSASGGSNHSSAAAARKIAGDIREAQAIILGNHFDATGIRRESITKSALSRMLHSLDPHSNFHDAAEWKELLDEQNSGYTGIGASIGDFTNGHSTDTYVLSVFPRSPAAAAKLRFGDRIVSVNGRKTTGIGLSAVRDMLRGASGSSLKITLERVATGEIQELTLPRNVVRQPSIPDAYIIRAGVGYIDLTEGFAHTTSDEFTKALGSLRQEGMRSLVLDLRWNGGGILDQAVKIAEKFLPAGTRILSQHGRSPMDTRIYDSANASVESMPLVVLVNSRTASASEIVAGAFQDSDRALIVGEKTYGKGLVQTVIDLPGNAGLTLTTGRYLTPAGRSIQRDYSSVDLYDYYNHKTPSSGVDKAYFEARTVTDRRVFGGDGIRPDEEIKTAEITSPQAALLDPIFGFTRELITGRTGHGNKPKIISELNKMALPDAAAFSDTLIPEFTEYLSRQPQFRISVSSIKEEEPFIRLRLRYYLVMASHGAVAATKVLTEADPQVSAAIEAVPRAAQLARQAARVRNAK